MTLLETLGRQAKQATSAIANLSLDTRNAILETMAQALENQQDSIITANKKDLAQYQETLSGPMQKRLTLTAQDIHNIAVSLRAVIDLPDPLAGPYPTWHNHADLKIIKKTVPLGVVAMIYEARPNVTVDAAALAIKSGNAIILRGGKEALNTNIVLTHILRQALQQHNLNPNIIQLITDTSHETVAELLHLRQAIDVLIPRGSAKFIDFVVKNATVPVIETGAGNTHIFVDDTMDENKAIQIIINAKTQKPSVCNAAEKLLIHENIAETFLPKIANALIDAGVTLRGDEASQAIVSNIQPATDQDWSTEYNDLIMAVHIVKNIDDAIDWINQYTTHHSETIISTNPQHVTQFMNAIDAAVVYQNASSRFTDGFEFGFGAEIGISTQKLHARGPMGLPALTTIKYEIYGDGQIRE